MKRPSKTSYKDKRRQKYLDERSAKNGDFSYDMLTTDEFNGEDILVDMASYTAGDVENEIMLDNLQLEFKSVSECHPQAQSPDSGKTTESKKFEIIWLSALSFFGMENGRAFFCPLLLFEN